MSTIQWLSALLVPVLTGLVVYGIPYYQGWLFHEEKSMKDLDDRLSTHILMWLGTACIIINWSLIAINLWIPWNFLIESFGLFLWSIVAIRWKDQNVLTLKSFIAIAAFFAFFSNGGWALVSGG